MFLNVLYQGCTNFFLGAQSGMQKVGAQNQIACPIETKHCFLLFITEIALINL